MNKHKKLMMMAISTTFRPQGLLVLLFNDIWEIKMLALSSFVFEESSLSSLHVYILK